MFHSLFLSIGIGVAAVSGSLVGQPQPQPAGQPAPAEQPSVVQSLQAEAELLKPLTTSSLARRFLDATSSLPDPGKRIVMRNKDKGASITPEQFDKLPEAERAGFVKREFLPRFYYYTGYGTPLVYARPLDILAENDKDHWTPDTLPSKRILDFGCGTIGHLRLLASLGADVTGVDVEPLFDALYSKPEDQGEIQGPNRKKGHLRFLTGQWPAEEAIVKKVKDAAGDGFDLFISKNTLKRGYIHPARAADPSRLVHLGVEDEAYVKAVYDSLKPGGIFLIYNISPHQAPETEPYIPHADGQCPFARELLEKTGFEVVKFDENDQDGILKYWMALGYNEGKDAEGTKHDLFAWWTMCRKPAKRSDAGSKGEIRITRNYAAAYNAEIAKIPEDQRAWPLYLEARKRLVAPSDELNDAGWPIRPDNDLWSKALEHIKQNEEAVRLIRQAASRPQLGVAISDQIDPEFEAVLAAERGEPAEPQVAPSENPLLFDVLLPHIGHLRYCTRILVMDSRRRYMEGDAEGFVDDCFALASVGRHASEPPSAITALVCVAVHALLNSVVMEQIDSVPQLLSDNQLESVAKVLKGIDDMPIVIKGLAAERDFLADFVQRAYTDDGHGNGVMTKKGWELLQHITAGPDGKMVPVPDFVKASIADRAATLSEFDAIAGEALAIINRPLWQWDRSPSACVDDRYNGLAARAKFALVTMLGPAYSKAGLAMTQGEQQRDAALVAIALERYRRRHDSYPATLDALVPGFLAAVPPDRFDGKPIKYRLVDGKPLLYSVGTDRDDDQGHYPEGNRWAANVWRSPAELAAFKRGDPDAPSVPDGDFVLYPEPGN